MSRLDKVIEKWDNLEDSYREASAKNTQTVLTKRDYLEQLLGFNSKIDSPELLKSLLKEESSSYNPVQYEEYENMIRILDYAYKNLLTFTGEIVNLQQFVFGEDTQAFRIENFAVYNTESNITNIKQALSDGYVTECVVQKEDGIHSYILGHEQSGYIAFRSFLEAAEFLHRPANEIMQSSFLSQVYYVLGNYVMNKRFIAPTVFLDNSLFSENGNKVSAGSLMFTLSKENLVERENVKITLMSGDKLEIPKVSYFVRQIRQPYGTTRVIFVR